MSAFPIETGILEGAAQHGRVHGVSLRPNVTATVTPCACLPPVWPAPEVQKRLAAQHGAHGPDEAASARKRRRAALDTQPTIGGRIYFQKIAKVRVP